MNEYLKIICIQQLCFDVWIPQKLKQKILTGQYFHIWLIIWKKKMFHFLNIFWHNGKAIVYNNIKYKRREDKQNESSRIITKEILWKVVLYSKFFLENQIIQTSTAPNLNYGKVSGLFKRKDILSYFIFITQSMLSI